VRFDITKHKLVPEHILLSKKEEKEILKKLNLTKNQLPKILSTDPVATAVIRPDGTKGVKVREIVKIIRNSPTSRVSVAYRVVVGR
jgi:DNA-directed RNA polymerase subunit H (RpoH/RPB5)